MNPCGELFGQAYQFVADVLSTFIVLVLGLVGGFIVGRKQQAQ